jgi:arsenical pump membrane protein
MPNLVRIPLTLGIFLATLVLILRRPRGWNEAWWAMGGAGVMLAARLVTWPEAVEIAKKGQDAVLMLVALLCLSGVISRSGFFEWAAILCARRARDDAHRLFRNTFLLGALVTATLSLDTTAVMLTPIVISFAQRLDLPRKPYILACAVVANCASLALHVSNLTNLLFVGTFHVSFGGFAGRMILPQLVVLAVTYVVLRRSFRRELPRWFDVTRLPPAPSAIVHPAFFRSSCVVLALVSVGYFVAPSFGVPVYVVAFAGALVLALCGVLQAKIGWGWLREVSWGAAALAVGLFVLVRGLENLGLVAPLVTRMAGLARGSAWWTVPAVAAATAVVSNGVNNLPGALLARSVLEQAGAPPRLIFGALIGADIGPNITIVGSLATILVLAVARGPGERVGSRDLFRVGAVVTPVALLAAAWTLVGVLTLWP